MHRGPMRVSSAMTKGPSLASVEEVRADDHVIGSSRAWRAARVRKSSSSSLIEKPIACSHPSTERRGCRFPDLRSDRL
jgi:hypothetical protein